MRLVASRRWHRVVARGSGAGSAPVGGGSRRTGRGAGNGPTAGAAPRSQASAVSRGLGAGYRWACVAPGAVADEREASGVLDLGYYCCLRPQSRVVGPFRDAAGPTGEGAR